MKHHVLLFAVLLIHALRSEAQPLDAFLLQYHAAGCDNQSGKLAVHATGGTGSYTYQWSNGSTIDTAYNLGAGLHSVTVYSGLYSVVRTVTLDSFGIETVNIQHACNGEYGSIFLNDINAQYPFQFHWYQDQVPISETTGYCDSLLAGTYQYALIDGDGCIDSGTVVIRASSPHMDVFMSDSSLCWGVSTQVWFTPGYILTDNWGTHLTTATDTFTYINTFGSGNIPTEGMDSLGCTTNSVAPLPFIYLQPHPDPLTVYQVGDTLSLSLIPNLAPDPDHTYNWWYHAQMVSSGGYSFLVIDSSGWYSVGQTNIYGCSFSGTINAGFAGLEETDFEAVSIYPNPLKVNEAGQLEQLTGANDLPYTLYDSNGKALVTGQMQQKKAYINAPENPGIYFLNLGNHTYKLIVIP
jgi:hypothetical protein